MSTSRSLLFAIGMLLSCAASGQQNGAGYAKAAGFAPIKDQEIRVWAEDYLGISGYSVLGNSVRSVWIQNTPKGLNVQRRHAELSSAARRGIRSALDQVKDLNGRAFHCRDILDGDAVLIEARFSGNFLRITADDPLECKGEELGRIANLVRLVSSRSAATHTDESLHRTR